MLVLRLMKCENPVCSSWDSWRQTGDIEESKRLCGTQQTAFPIMLVFMFTPTGLHPLSPFREICLGKPTWLGNLEKCCLDGKCSPAATSEPPHSIFLSSFLLSFNWYQPTYCKLLIISSAWLPGFLFLHVSYFRSGCREVQGAKKSSHFFECLL